MTTASVVSTITDVKTVGDQILATIEGLDPAVDVPATTAASVLDLSAQLVTAALTAWSAASGVPITQESIAALLPNAAPLSAPTE